MGTKLKTAIFGRSTIWNIYYLKGVINGLPLAKLFVLRFGKCMLFMVIPHFFPMNVMLGGRERWRGWGKQQDCTDFILSTGRSQENNIGIDLKTIQKGIYQSQLSSFNLNLIAVVL